MKNNTKAIQVFGLVLAIAGVGVFNNTLTMEQPIYEILARKQANKFREIQEGNRKWFPEDYDFGKEAEKTYSDLIKEYKKYELIFQSGKSPRGLPWFGGLDYSMTLEGMKQHVKKIFSAMKESGLIISKDQFKPIKDKYFYHPFTDLTRIWGRMYLKNKINESPNLSATYDVPKCIIVVDNPHEISVNITFGSSPAIALLNNGEIYFENIKGKGIAHEEMKRGGIGIGEYVDYKDAGNIIQQEGTGKKYIVDTEAKSFEVSDASAAKGLGRFLEYASERFKYLNPVEDPYTYEFNLP